MEIRSIETTFEQNDNIIEGYAIRFNCTSNVLYDKEKRRFFREIIDREAINQELIDNSDIKFLFNHDKERLLARRNRGTGSLNVELREDGVYFSFEIPNTTVGGDLKEMIKRGEVTTCSFAFVDGDSIEWDFSNREVPTRTVKSIRGLFDLSAVFDAAYSQTEISCRSLNEMIEAQTQTDETWKQELNNYRQRLNE
ncbi:HK97 family phage prohead protease [Bacteroides congonensis]|uniref:HK97 family phage prohead protease n=1 Tax=Bacteroides congonensis TaxID=1871006 RepID=UPI000933BB83|nr:HK97 family phage prohead protease [Bacteroides congonensis]